MIFRKSNFVHGNECFKFSNNDFWTTNPQLYADKSPAEFVSKSQRMFLFFDMIS
jgi:hypothetical protein